MATLEPYPFNIYRAGAQAADPLLGPSKGLIGIIGIYKLVRRPIPQGIGDMYICFVFWNIYFYTNKICVFMWNVCVLWEMYLFYMKCVCFCENLCVLIWTVCVCFMRNVMCFLRNVCFFVCENYVLFWNLCENCVNVYNIIYYITLYYNIISYIII